MTAPHERPATVLISAGDASGDVHAAALVRALIGSIYLRPIRKQQAKHFHHYCKNVVLMRISKRCQMQALLILIPLMIH